MIHTCVAHVRCIMGPLQSPAQYQALCLRIVLAFWDEATQGVKNRPREWAKLKQETGQK